MGMGDAPSLYLRIAAVCRHFGCLPKQAKRQAWEDVEGVMDVHGMQDLLSTPESQMDAGQRTTFRLMAIYSAHSRRFLGSHLRRAGG